MNRKALGGAILALAFLGSFSIASQLFDREPPVRYERVRALSDTVPQGGTIEVEFSVFRLRLCEGTARRWLTDSTGTRHSIPQFTVGPRPLAGLDTYRRTITIPEAAATGPASYQVEISYACNVVHRLGWPIEVQSPPIGFLITPRPALQLPPLFTVPHDSDS